MRIGIKVGSLLLTNIGNGLNNEMVLKVSQQISELLASGHQVFLVTSGAVASDPKKHRAKNLRAAVGMGRLIRRYIEYFDIFGVEVAQVLLTDHDLHDHCRDSLIGLLDQAMANRIVPILNANDSVDWQELEQLKLCADNDVLFMNLCLALRPDLAIIGFDQLGVLGEDDKPVRLVTQNNFLHLLEFVGVGNESGHGEFGMLTKMQVARHLSRSDIKTIIAPGRADNFILRAVQELEQPIGSFGTWFQFDQLELPFLTPEPLKIKTLEELKLGLG